MSEETPERPTEDDYSDIEREDRDGDEGFKSDCNGWDLGERMP